ncbi:MAG: hypothetical protein N2170_04725 [Bacteroidia bacterium]|nr:hypothetical protein [Bacteroidia bacterium]
MVERWRIAFAILTHPAVIQAGWISYWSRWKVGWVISSWGLLVGVAGLLYVWARQAPRDISFLLGSERRFLLLWHLFATAGLWSATAEPLLHYWLSFFLWLSFWGFLLHWWKEYSFHVYGWAALACFYLFYGGTYPEVAGLFVVFAIGVAYLRYVQGAHTLEEIARGAGWGAGASFLFILFRSFT